MSALPELDALCEALNIQWRYHDSVGGYHETPFQSRQALCAAMGYPADNPEIAAQSLQAIHDENEGRIVPQWLVVEAGQDLVIPVDRPCRWEITFENGTVFGAKVIESITPGIIPLGIHTLKVDDHETTLLAAPASLPSPARSWGVTLPIYGLRTAEQGSIGTYADLKQAVEAFGTKGASFVGINPIHAGFPTDPVEFSPYAPSNRRRLNITHIAPSVDHATDHEDLIDYTKAFPARMEALRRDYDNFVASGKNAAYERYLANEGDALIQFATHQALSERYGPFWSDWPDPYKDCTSAEVQAVALSNEDHLQFHCWLQWRAEQQLGEVNHTAHDLGMSHGLYLDLAVGTHPYGAETWAEPDLFATGVSIGSPPDAFSAEGQVWGLAPMSPHALAAKGFRPLAETLRRQLKFAKLLRIDHILGFARSYWVPEGGEGAYISMPREAMLAVVRIEAARAGATIVGEDLGNIPDGLRDDLNSSGILGCRVAVFERHWDGDGSFISPENYPEQVLASFATHDLPTWEGWKKGRDIEWRREVGDIDEGAEAHSKGERQHEVGMLEAHIGGSSSEDLHCFLARTSARMVALQVEDILGLTEQPNLPGTIFDHPNWRRRLPIPASALATDARVEKTAKILSESGR